MNVLFRLFKELIKKLCKKSSSKISRLKNYNITGLDSSNAMLQIAKKKAPNIRYKLGDANNKSLFDFHKFDIKTKAVKRRIL